MVDTKVDDEKNYFVSLAVGRPHYPTLSYIILMHWPLISLDKYVKGLYDAVLSLVMLKVK